MMKCTHIDPTDTGALLKLAVDSAITLYILLSLSEVELLQHSGSYCCMTLE